MLKRKIEEGRTIENFQSQIVQMNEDYETMKKNRETAKKELNNRFELIQKKIDESRTFVATEDKKISDIINEFQRKFGQEIKLLQDGFQKNVDDLRKNGNENVAKCNSEVEQLKTKLNEQKSERIKLFEETNKEFHDKLSRLQETLRQSKKLRLEGQSTILKNITQEGNTMSTKLNKQRDERNVKMNQIQEFLNYELKSQKEHNQQYLTKNLKDFTGVVEQLETEFNNRFASKDQIVDSLVKITKTVQDTLRHPN